MFTLPCPALPCPALPCPALLCPCACRLLLLAISLKSRETSALTETSALLAPRIPANVELRSESNIETKRIVCGFFFPHPGKISSLRDDSKFLAHVTDDSNIDSSINKLWSGPRSFAAADRRSFRIRRLRVRFPSPPLPSNSSGVRLEEPTWSRSARRPEIRRARRTTRKRRSADQATNQI